MYATFRKFWKADLQIIFLIWILSFTDHNRRRTQATFLISKSNVISLKLSFFLSVINELNKLYSEIQNAPNFKIFKKNILKFIKPTENNIFTCHNLKDIKQVTRWRLELTHVHDDKFQNNSQNTLNLPYTCSWNVKNTCNLPTPTVLSSLLRKTFFSAKLLIW